MLPSDLAPATPHTAPVLVMPLPVLARFRQLMLSEGWEVDLQRLCVDDAYAFQCLATGHCSSDPVLRHTAVRLFAAFRRNTAPPALH